MWPLNNGAQTLIDYFESHGIQEADCEVLTASFTSDVTEVCETNDVSFNDESIGGAISWNWTFEGGDPATSTDQNPTVTYDIAGTYNVGLEVSDGTETNSVLMENYISVNTCSGINMPDLVALNVYPNPTDGKFELELNSSGAISIKVYNMLGVLVYEEDTNAPGKYTKSIDLTGMEDGIYFISIQTDNKVYGKKLKLLSK
jgi:PKD repeat protein